MNRGKYIVLEGPEGVGKTTQLIELARRLQAAGLPVRTLREPDSQSDLTARAIRQLTQDPRYPMNTNTEVLLYNAARSQSLQVIKRSVEQGVVCVVDRNYLTTLAIQYYGRGDVPDYETINRIISFAVNGMEPDLTIVLDAPVPVLKERLGGRYHGERFDNLDSAFLERVRAGYLWEAKQRNLPVVFATEDSEAVSENIWKLVADSLATRDAKAPSTSQPTALKDILETKKLAAAPHEPPMEAAVITGAAETIPSSETETQEDMPSDPYDFFVPDSFDSATADTFRATLSSILQKRDELLEKLNAGPEAVSQITELLLPIASCKHKDGSAGPLGLTFDIQDELAAIAKNGLDATYTKTDDSQLRLVEYWPRSELSLVPGILYPYTDVSLENLKDQVDEWSYDQKAAALSSYTHALQGQAPSSVGYEVDLITDCTSLLSLRPISAIKIENQPLSPRHGFDVPDALVEASLLELFESCFDASLELYSQLQANGYGAEAGYAVLLGHKQRLKLTIPGNSLAILNERATTSPALQKWLPELIEAIAQVHPLLSTQYQLEKQVA